MEKLDYKKTFPLLYLPKTQAALVEVPSMNFFTVDGKGAPEAAAYQEAVEILYALAYTVKMSKMSGQAPADYLEYVVPPLEGLWWGENDGFDIDRRDTWQWRALIRQPEFVDQAALTWAVAQCQKKKPQLAVDKAKLQTWTEGLCVQMLHIGPYAEEGRSIEQLHAYIAKNGLQLDFSGERKHHEIYLSDPRKTKPEQLKTVLRLPVRR